MNELEKLLQRYAHAYYCLDVPEISDSEYDLLFRRLKEENPDSEILKRVGQGICKELHNSRSK